MTDATTQTGTITQALAALAAGEHGAGSRLVPLVYPELRRLAAAHMRRERPGHTLQSTALVHEAYVRLLGQRAQNYENRGHFFGVASHLMRLILVDHARAKLALKRGGQAAKLDLDAVALVTPAPQPFLLSLDQALERLAAQGPRQCQVVEMRYFGGLTDAEVAAVLGISDRTVKRDWRLAKAFLYQEMNR